jgi:hypothetical protein
MFKDHLMLRANFFRLIRTLITSILLLLYLPSIQAQDTIVKRNDEKIAVKILEVNPGDIKYKRFDYQEGPIFTLPKWELKCIIYNNGVKENCDGYSAPITNGNEKSFKNDLTFQPAGKFYYYHDQKIAEQNMLDIAWKLNDKKINYLIRKTEKEKVVKNCFRIGGITLDAIGFLTFAGVFSAYKYKANSSTVGNVQSIRAAQMADRAQRQRTGGCMILGGICCELASITFNIQETRHAHGVVDLYNKSILQEK